MLSPGPGTPQYLQQAYDLSALSASAGVGDTVAIVDAYYYPNAESDLAYYRSYFGLPACTTANGCFSAVGQDGSSTLPTQTNRGWQTEMALDLDSVSALCPSCDILLVEANSSADSDLVAAEHAAYNAGADQVSDSWMSNGPVGTLSASDFVYPGVATLAAAGDSGWDTGNTNTAWPAGLTGVNAIGGTDLNSSTAARGFTESAWSGTGSGCADEAKPSYQTDSGCTGRSYNDISADADPYTGIAVYLNGGFILYGGTSLATPLTAAYYALTRGPGQGDVAWNYAQGTLLNDPSTGNNSGGGACTPSYICNAGVGYDGPTGMGSISGQVIAGAPGLGAPDTATGYLQSETSTTAVLTAGVYPNGVATTYHWDYGPTTAYGQSTTSASASAGIAVVGITTTLTGLTSGVNYHYRLVASNADGTVYGYDYNLAGSAPSAPTVDGIAASNLTVSGTTATIGAAINPQGWTTTYHFVYGTSPSTLTTSTPTTDAVIGSQSADVAVSQNLTGLTPGTTYYFETVATNGVGVTTSDYAAFTTTGSAPAATAGDTTTTEPSAGTTAQTSATGTARTGTATRALIDPLQSPSPAGAPAPAITDFTNLTSGQKAGLEALTGLPDPAADLAVENNCPPPTAATASCASQVLINKATGLPWVSPLATGTPADPIFSPPTIDTPQHLLQSYDLMALSQTAGAGDTVGIVDAYGYTDAASDLATFRSYFGLPAVPQLRIVDENGGTDLPPEPTGDEAGWQFEEAMDLDTVSTVCPKCNILLVQAASENDSDLIAAEHTAARLGANQISNSWARDSPIGTDSDFSFPGVAIVAAGGDYGYLPNPPFVEYPAALPDVTAAGGTELLDATTPGARGVTETASTIDSSGCSSEPKPVWQLDTGCTGRVYNDMSADGEWPDGIFFYDPEQYGAIGNYSGGGTSLSTAIIAAYYALLDTSDTSAGENSPVWDYNNAAALNPIVSGNNSNNNGSCGPPILYVCQAGPGYNGPGGNGSVSGDAVAGAPGIAAPQHSDDEQYNNIGNYESGSTPTSVTLSGGVYPNQLDTHYYWQYGSTTAYGQQTPPTDIGSGLGAVAVTNTISGLTNGQSYHYRLIASNADGTSYGYDFVMTPLAPIAPVISGFGPMNLSVHADSATPEIDVNPNYFDTDVVFDYGTSPTALNFTSTPTDAGSGNATTAAATTVTGLSPNTTYYVEATATNAAGTAITPQWESFTTPSPANSAPTNTTPPTITGIATTNTLSAAPGTWSGYPTPTFAYQWQDCDVTGANCLDIVGATNTSYTPVDADGGLTLRAVVTATNSQGSSAVSSAASALVQSPPGNTAVPSISGSALVEDTLSATRGTWTGYPAPAISYQWQDCDATGANCLDIVDATNASYTPVDADGGFTLRAVVTATNASGSASAGSPQTAVLQSTPLSLAAPLLTGSAQTGQTLRSSPGTWSTYPAPFAYAYQWQRSADQGSTWAAIPGASTSAYVLSSGDLGFMVRAQVTAANAVGTTVQASAPSAVVIAAPTIPTAPVALAAPTISTTGGVLSATAGSWTGAPTSGYAYQWQTLASGGFADIPGATKSSYTPGLKMVGSLVRVRVTATNAVGPTVQYSAQTVITRTHVLVPASAPVVKLRARRVARDHYLLSSANTHAIRGRHIVSYSWTNEGQVIGNNKTCALAVSTGRRYQIALTVSDSAGQRASAKLVFRAR
jgi:subtilase family serine protease